MCSIIFSPLVHFLFLTAGQGGSPLCEAWLNERKIFSRSHSDCFPSVLPHWPRCRCCERPSRWECHKWPETNVGLPHPFRFTALSTDFLFCISMFFSASSSPPSSFFTLFQPECPTFIPFFHSQPSALVGFSRKKSSLRHFPLYPLNRSCFHIPLHFQHTYICHVKLFDSQSSEASSILAQC